MRGFEFHLKQNGLKIFEDTPDAPIYVESDQRFLFEYANTDLSTYWILWTSTAGRKDRTRNHIVFRAVGVTAGLLQQGR